MSLSLNEVEAAAKKAARGAGYTWGLAEEAGKAVRWLCARDLDGCAALAALLEWSEGKDPRDLAPEWEEAGWSAKAALCPLTVGAVISDHVPVASRKEIELGEVVQPILLVPFAAILADQFATSVSVTWSGGKVVVDRDNAWLEGQVANRSPWARIEPNGRVADPRPHRTRARPDAKAWRILNSFAHRTYAPATEESRLKGAGAGTTDND